jgi:hypothetical protein
VLNGNIQGCTGNASILVRPLPGLLRAPAPDVALLGLRYDPRSFSPAFVVGNWMWHLIRLLAQPANTLETRYREKSPVEVCFT